MRNRHRSGQNSGVQSVNQNCVTGESHRGVAQTFSPNLDAPSQIIGARIPFGGDKEEERDFLRSLYVCRRFTTGQPWDGRP